MGVSRFTKKLQNAYKTVYSFVINNFVKKSIWFIYLYLLFTKHIFKNMESTNFNEAYNRLAKKEENTELFNFFSQEMKRNNQKPYGFFDSILVRYGVNSLMSLVSVDDIYGCFPAASYSEKNIFKEKRGTLILSDKELSRADSDKMLAAYLVSKLKVLTVSDFKNWEA